MPEFDARVRRSADSVLFWGEDRVAVAAVAAALSRARSAHVTWVDVTDTPGAPEPYEAVVRDGLPAGQLRVALRPRQLLLDPTVPIPPVWSVVRADENESTVRALGGFLELPPAMQRLFAALEPADRKPTLLLTNVDRLAAHYPEDVGGYRDRIEVFASGGVKIVGSLAGPARADRFAFRHVLRVWTRGGRRDWRESVVVLETPPPDPEAAGARVTALRDIPSLAAVLASRPEPSEGGSGAERGLAAA